MESVYHIVTIRVNETSWARVWRLRSLYLKTWYDILGVGMSSSLVGRNWRMAQERRRWSLINFRISVSSMVDGLNISGCDVAMEAEQGF
jgi:hypothetical protein